MKINTESGFSLLEVLISAAILSMLASIAYPAIGSFRTSMSVTHSSRGAMLKLAHIRSEAIRAKQSVRVAFNLSGMNWDIGDDSVIEGTYTLPENTEFDVIPDDIVFDGFGFAREIGSSLAISIRKGYKSSSFNINENGHIEKN